MNYIAIKQACTHYNKSQSTLRRIVKELKESNLSALQFELLPNGIERILISVDHLNTLFESKKNESLNSMPNDNIQFLQKIIQEQSQQINQLHLILSQNNTLLLESKKKKRWWKK